MRKLKGNKIFFSEESSESATGRTASSLEGCSLSPFRSISERGPSELGDTDYATLVRFSTLIQRPRWEVKFPLVLPTPTLKSQPFRTLPKSKSSNKLLPIREQESAQEAASRPLTESRPRLTSPLGYEISPRRTLQHRKNILKQRSSEAMKVIEEKCHDLLSSQKRRIRTRTRELKRLRAGLKTCEKHAGLIAASNDRASYYLLRLKFQQMAISK